MEPSERVTKQLWPSFIPCLFRKPNSPVVETGMASLSCVETWMKRLREVAMAPSRPSADTVVAAI